MVLPSNISDNNIILTQDNIVEYSWPVTVDNGVTLTFGSNLTFTSSINYFIIGSNNVIIDGSGYTVDINGVVSYPGLVKNEVYLNTSVQNINIITHGSSTLSSGGGWIGQINYTTGGDLTNNFIQNCSSTGPISTVGSGGIVGSFSGQNANTVLTIKNCYSTGVISGERAGGIAGRSCGQNGAKVSVINCYSTGAISGNNNGGVGKAGGIYGSGAGGTGSCEAINCYSTGSISTILNSANFCGGIYGAYNQGSIYNVQATNCYVAGSSSTGTDSYSNFVPGIFAVTPGSSKQLSCFVENTWSTQNAQTVLTGIGLGIWNTTVNNSPSPHYDLSVFNTVKPVINGFTIPNQTYGIESYTIINPTSTSPGTFTYTSDNPSVATVSGNNITITGVGTSNITALQAPTDTFGPGKKTTIFTVSAATPTFGVFNDLDKSYGDAPFTIIPPTSNSNGSFTYISSDPTVASISGNTITILKIGTCTITARQAAYNPYGQGEKTTTLTVRGPPTISNFNGFSKNYGDAPFTITAPTSNSNGAFTYSSSNNSVASVSGTTITIVSAGSCTITATQAAYSSYGVGTATLTFTVNAILPIIGTLDLSPLPKTYGDVPFTIPPPTSSSSGSFTYTSSDPTVASISGNTITILKVGTCTITATEAAAGNYSSATQTATLTVSSANPGLGVLTLPPSKTYGDVPFTITPPTSSSSGSFTYTSSDPTVASISGNTITILKVGTCTITATQAAAGNYSSATQTATLTVSPANPGLGVLTLPPSKTYGDVPFTIAPPTSSSSGSFTFTSSNNSVASVSGRTITIVGAGSCTITATQTAAGNYSSATQTATLNVSPILPTFGAFIDLEKSYGDAPFTIAPPTSNGSGLFTFSSSDNTVASVSGTTITIVDKGTITITATQAAAGNYSARSISATLTVKNTNQVSSSITLTPELVQRIEWPLYITGGNSQTPVVLTLGSDFTFTDDNHYFSIGGSHVEINGAGHSINISGVSNYSGLVKNPNHNNVVLRNLSVNSIGGSSLKDGAGWIGQAGYGADATELECHNCNSNGPINGIGSGGIFGQNLAHGISNILITECRSRGVISGEYSGGIVGAYSHNISILNSSSSGNISGPYTGGIVGYGANNNTIHTSLCYSTGRNEGIKSRGVYALLETEI
jgi:uncharacterized protein YjdB